MAIVYTVKPGQRYIEEQFRETKYNLSIDIYTYEKVTAPGVNPINYFSLNCIKIGGSYDKIQLNYIIFYLILAQTVGYTPG